MHTPGMTRSGAESLLDMRKVYGCGPVGRTPWDLPKEDDDIISALYRPRPTTLRDPRERSAYLRLGRGE